MKAWRVLAVGVAGVWVCGALQQALAVRVSIFGVGPDFLLLFCATFGLLNRRAPGAVCGFGAGLMHGALAGANLSHYVVSRTVAGFSSSWLRQWRFEQNAAIVGTCVALASILGGLVFMFLAAPKAIFAYLGDTILSALYNGLLAMPLHALLKGLLGTVDEDRQLGFRR